MLFDVMLLSLQVTADDYYEDGVVAVEGWVSFS